MPAITDRIDNILFQRHQTAEVICRQIDAVKQAKEAAQDIMSTKATIVDASGNLKPGSPMQLMFASDFDSLSALRNLSASPFFDAADKLIEDYEELYRRFSREFINIAVVGTARQGKSRLLQTLSGLDDRCIPAFTGDHCTGAASIIQNAPNEHVEVQLTFKSKEKLLQEAQSYMDVMTNKQYRLGSVDELKGLSKERIHAYIEDLPEEKKAEAIALKSEFFRRFVDHYDEWRNLLGQPDKIEHDENEIMYHVAQHNGKKKDDGREEYFRFVAVERALVRKKFVNEDAGKIQLIDTEGLGANTTNTDSNMIETIRAQSDAVVFVKRPESETGGSPTSGEIKVFGNMRGTFADRKMDLWCAFLLNRTSSASPFGDNVDRCRAYLNYMNQNNVLPTAQSSIVDVAARTCTNEEVVGAEDFIVSFLNDLSKNLKEIDQTYIDLVADDANAAYIEYCNLSGALKNIISLQATGGNNFANVFALLKETNENALAKLRALNIELSEKRNEPCAPIREELKNIVKDIFKRLPSAQEIRSNYNRRGNITPQTLYAEYLNNFRNEISKTFVEMDTPLDALVAEVKNQIADSLLKDGKLEKIMPELQQQGLCPYEQLSTLAQEVLSEKEYPQLRSAIDFLTEYELSVRGSLIYAVRSKLFEFSMLNSNIATGVSFEGDVGDSIQYNLDIALGQMQNYLDQIVRQFYVVPNEALYALCDEFYDRVTFSKAVSDEWIKLYGEYQVQIWADELAETNKFRDAIKTWKTYVDAFDRCKSKSNFVIPSA